MANNFLNDDNCVALWNFEQNGADSKGGNELTEVNTPGYSVDHREGLYSADLHEDSSQYFTITDGELDDGLPGKYGMGEQSFAICFRTKVHQLTERMGFINKFDENEGAAGALAYRIWFNQADSKIVFSLGYNIGYTSLAYDIPITTGRWYHVGATYNAADNILKLRIWDNVAGGFLNPVTPTQSITATDDMSPSNVPLDIGRDLHNDAYCLHGHMYEVVIFKDVLSDAEIDQIRARTYTGIQKATVGIETPTGVLSSILKAKRTISGILPLVGSIEINSRIISGALSFAGAVVGLPWVKRSSTITGIETPAGAVGRKQKAKRTISGILAFIGNAVSPSTISGGVSAVLSFAGALSGEQRVRSLDPQAMLEWSDDGGRTWSNEHWASIGKIGEYRKRAKWRRLGSSRNRTFRLTITDPIEVEILAANMTLQKGRA